MLTHTLTDNSVTVLGDDFVPKTMPASHPAFDQVVTALKSGDDKLVKQLMDLPNAIASFMQGKIQVTERQLFYDGRPLNGSLATRILQFMEEGQADLAKPLINFLEKVRENPSYRATEGLYDWAVKSGLPITPEGDIIAWKIVKQDYRDIHSDSFDNSIGNIVEMPRNEVDEDPDRTCSSGLHVCSTSYLPSFGSNSKPTDRVLVVRVHPRDFVAVPRDYNCSKARVCRYEVLGEMPREKATAYLRSCKVYEPVGFRSDPLPRLGELDLDINVGSYYRTRDGNVVEIQRYDEEASSDYPYFGRIVNGDGDEEAWTYDGVYYTGADEHDLDLVEELEDYVPDEVEATEPPRRSFFSAFVDGLLGR